MDLETLQPLVALARAEFGEAEFTYSKSHVSWVSSRKRGEKGSHFRTITGGTPISKEEYDANIAEAKRVGLEAFMGRYQRSYWDYDKKLSRSGWREKLVEMIKALPDSASTNEGKQ